MADKEEIEGIKIVPKIKYLGLLISCDRAQIKRDAKAKCKKFIDFVKGKIQTRDPSLMKVIQAAYYRSLLVYFMTPLLGAGIMKKQEINGFEDSLRRT